MSTPRPGPCQAAAASIPGSGLAADLRKSVQTIQEKGFGKGHPEVIETLWPKGTIAREDIEGLVALRKQSSSSSLAGRLPAMTRRPRSQPDQPSESQRAARLDCRPRVRRRQTARALGRSFATPSVRRPRARDAELPHRATSRGPELLGEPIEIQYRGLHRGRMGSASGAKGFNTLAATSSAGTSSRRRWR